MTFEKTSSVHDCTKQARLKHTKITLVSIVFLAAMVPLVVLAIYFLSRDGVSADSRCNNKLVIDHDGGADDAMAIFMALLNEKYFNGPEVVALTTTHGNVDETQSFNNTQRILDIADRQDVTIYRGSGKSLITSFDSDFYFGYDGLGDQKDVTFDPIEADETTAALALIELSKKYEGRLTVVALGAATNVALAIRLDPNFIRRISKLYVAAGHIYGEKYNEAEFNAMMDVESYHIIAENATPEKVTAVPFSSTMETLNITVDWRLNVLGAIPTKIMKEQNGFERESIPKTSYWSLLDPAAMAVVLKDNLVYDSGRSYNDIILCGKERGINTNNFEANKPNMRLIKGVDESLFKQLLIDLFSAELNDS